MRFSLCVFATLLAAATAIPSGFEPAALLEPRCLPAGATQVLVVTANVMKTMAVVATSATLAPDSVSLRSTLPEPSSTR
ncbi:uncharacterized protein F4822DRAFT_434914 [Hypoxylon trugodes]|uniref:uncharacterized protein n=1 Tax=Hypoxylon trugodes TaxID=326681 RepID=UPI00219BA0D0|nr:uncharacterized protein F4822DRAFT_434914 [Hypoxylon trugodes]KAI1382987.1 hypothetical protein F4822DRAFT_434914 [Hypoxylon trugodes]